MKLLFFVSLLVTSRVSRADTKQQRGVLSSFYAGWYTFICDLRTRVVAVEITNKCGMLKNIFVSTALKCSRGIYLKLLKIMLPLKSFPCCCCKSNNYCSIYKKQQLVSYYHIFKTQSVHIVEMMIDECCDALHSLESSR